MGVEAEQGVCQAHVEERVRHSGSRPSATKRLVGHLEDIAGVSSERSIREPALERLIGWRHLQSQQLGLGQEAQFRSDPR